MILDILSSICKLITPKHITECPDVKMNLVTRSKLEKEIHTVFNEYKKFMNIDQSHPYVQHMPEYKLFLKQYTKFVAEGAVKYQDGIYQLYISEGVFQDGLKKDILFHEFSHIYDREYLYAKWKFPKEPLHADYTHIYTEIHAEQVRFLYVLGAANIDESIQKITHNTKVLSLAGEEKEFYVCLSDLKKDIILYSNKFKKVQLEKKKLNDAPFECITDKIAYFIGAFSVYQNFCKHKLDDLLDFGEITDFWEKDIRIYDKQSVQNLQQLIGLCCSKELEQLSKSEISDIGTLLMHNWYANAKDNLHIR